LISAAEKEMGYFYDFFIGVHEIAGFPHFHKKKGRANMTLPYNSGFAKKGSPSPSCQRR
jgi:hypothetical protein